MAQIISIRKGAEVYAVKAHTLIENPAFPIYSQCTEKFRTLKITSGVKMSALKKQRIDLRLTEEDKDLIEEAAAMTNQTITQFMVNSASERAAEVIEQHRRLILNENSWNRVMDALDNPPEPNDQLKRAAKRLQNME